MVIEEGWLGNRELRVKECMFTAQGPQVLCFTDSSRVLHAVEMAVVQFTQVKLVLYNVCILWLPVKVMGTIAYLILLKSFPI